jgi:hypothetical protein
MQKTRCPTCGETVEEPASDLDLVLLEYEELGECPNCRLLIGEAASDRKPGPEDGEVEDCICIFKSHLGRLVATRPAE